MSDTAYLSADAGAAKEYALGHCDFELQRLRSVAKFVGLTGVAGGHR